MSTIFWKTPWIQTSAGTAYVKNATGQRAHLQWKRYSSTKPLNRLSKMACGTWSPARTPLTKEIFFQERGQTDDHWEDEAEGDQDVWGEDDEDN